MNTRVSTNVAPLSAFQTEVLTALAAGAILYAKPDGKLCYFAVNREMAGGQQHRVLRIVPPRDFYRLLDGYLQPTQKLPGMGMAQYGLTLLGQQAVGGDHGQD